jgi:hypothetical protein
MGQTSSMRIAAPIAVSLLLALGLAGYGLAGARVQHRMLTEYVPRVATVVEAQDSTAGFGAHRPKITFRYTVRGLRYEAERLAPLPQRGSRQWAQNIINAYRPTSTVTAYVNPDNATEAFLLPAVSFFPYACLLGAVAVLFAGLIPLRAAGLFDPTPQPRGLAPRGWYRLSRTTLPAERAVTWVVIAVVWYVAGAVICGHYALLASWPYEPWGLASVVYFAAGSWALWQLGRATKLAGCFGEPQVFCTLPVVSLDQPVIARLTLPISRDLDVRELRVSVVCQDRVGISSQRLFSSSHSIIENQRLCGGSVVFEDLKFEVPEKKRRSSSPFNRLAPARIEWFIELNVTLCRGGRFVVRFPLEASVPTRRAQGESAA